MCSTAVAQNREIVCAVSTMEHTIIECSRVPPKKTEKIYL